LKKNLGRAVIETGFIFLFYSNLLMGEFERSGIGQKNGMTWAIRDVFTTTNFEIAAVEKELATRTMMRVIPLHVLALLKIVAYMDDRHGRTKDLEDLGQLMQQYELEGESRFGDEIFEAGRDFESAGAFLLGLDVGRLCKGTEAEIVTKTGRIATHPYTMVSWQANLSGRISARVCKSVLLNALVSMTRRTLRQI
jgi:hypothetical protein